MEIISATIDYNYSGILLVYFSGMNGFAKRILIVDDDSEIRQFLKTIIDSKERIVEAVGTMEEARAILETGSVDLLLLDLYLPDGNGIKLLSDLRERPKTIIMTAFGGWESHVKAYNLGAFYYLDKPFKVSQLRILVDQALRAAV
jgi:DNA-binding response OmpR family regulator